jgi:hypothetical protein
VESAEGGEAAVTPVWLLDVDGVINVARPGWHATPQRGVAYAQGMGWPMRWAPKLVDRIRSAHTSGLVEVRWCTTWCPYAEQLELLFQLPELVRALSGEPIPGGPVSDAMKLAAAYAVLDEGRALIWTDDTAVPDVGPDRTELVNRGALLIRPQAKRGLQAGDLDDIEAFARSYASQAHDGTAQPTSSPTSPASPASPVSPVSPSGLIKPGEQLGLSVEWPGVGQHRVDPWGGGDQHGAEAQGIGQHRLDQPGLDSPDAERR